MSPSKLKDYVDACVWCFLSLWHEQRQVDRSNLKVRKTNLPIPSKALTKGCRAHGLLPPFSREP